MNIVEFSRRAGVSTATISRAFHEPEKLRPETRDRILALASKLGYYPSPSGRALKRGRHDALGLIWPLEVEGPGADFAQRILAALTTCLVANDLDLLLCPVNRSDPATLEHARRTLQRSRCDAWILLYPRYDDPLLSALRAARKPVVCLMGHLAEAPEWKSVRLNQEGWMDEALGRLRRAGARRVVFFGSRSGEPDHKERERAFAKLAPRHFRSNVASLPGSPPDGQRLQELLSRQAVDAVLGADDRAALAALEVCREMGRLVPADVKVVGIDDVPQARYSHPPLSTFRQPLDEMAACAVELALGGRTRSRLFEAAFVPRLSLPEA
jgi:LacI family transcriptional regulator